LGSPSRVAAAFPAESSEKEVGKTAIEDEERGVEGRKEKRKKQRTRERRQRKGRERENEGKRKKRRHIKVEREN
jgi:hypothetical protein